MFDMAEAVKLCEPEVTITEGAPRQVSKVCERYITQRGSVGTRMGLGFNFCIVPALMFCPCILGGWVD